MITLALALVLAAGPGASLRGSPPVFSMLPGTVAPLTATGDPFTTMRASTEGTMVGIHWESTQAGAPGGGSTFTLAVTADGVEICAAVIDCNTFGDGNASCSGEFTTGQDIHFEVSASSCAALPRLVGGATWSQ